MTSIPGSIPSAVLDTLAAGAEEADRQCEWPRKSWTAIRDAGILSWAIPKEFGGVGLDNVALTTAMEDLTSACLTMTFALSQRDAAIRMLLKGPTHLKQRFLPPLATGDSFMTVGLS